MKWKLNELIWQNFRICAIRFFQKKWGLLWFCLLSCCMPHPQQLNAGMIRYQIYLSLYTVIEISWRSKIASGVFAACLLSLCVRPCEGREGWWEELTLEIKPHPCDPGPGVWPAQWEEGLLSNKRGASKSHVNIWDSFKTSLFSGISDVTTNDSLQHRGRHLHSGLPVACHQVRDNFRNLWSSRLSSLRNFTYEGKAPDAFLIAGIKSPEANDKPEVVFPFPFEVGSKI